MPSATDDPVRLLMSAARDRLLEYAGHTMGDRYEVSIAGESRHLPAGAVSGTVERLRAVRRIETAGVAIRLLRVDPDTGSFRIAAAGVEHVVPAELVVDWVDGYLAGFRRGDRPHRGRDTFGEIWSLLEEPSIPDQARLVVLGLMYGNPAGEMSMDDMAKRIGRTKKTVIKALEFGRNLAPEMANLMLSVFGRRWKVTAEGTRDEAAEVGGTEPAPEMPGIARLRWIGQAVRRGWLRYVGTPSVNSARWSRRYELAVGPTVYQVPAEALEGWLFGLEAWYEQAQTVADRQAAARGEAS